MRLIDADALIEKCGNWYVEEGTESGFIGTLKNLLAMQPTVQPDLSEYSDKLWKSAYERGKAVAEDMRPVEPERKEGAWINEGRIIRCNKCKIGYAAVKGMKSALTYNFCPSCGADMRGGDST